MLRDYPKQIPEGEKKIIFCVTFKPVGTLKMNILFFFRPKKGHAL